MALGKEERSLAGKGGDVAWRNPRNQRMVQPFRWRIPDHLVQKGTVYYYNDFSDMESHCPHFEGVVEMGLWLAGLWGFEKVLLVGVDLDENFRGKYAKLWQWKPHRDREDKFSNMSKALIERREEFPAKLYHCSSLLSNVLGDIEIEYIPPSRILEFSEK